jgi:putative flippase GtrA
MSPVQQPREAPPRRPTEVARRIGRGTRRPENWVQLVKFGVVGASGYFVNLSVFALLAAILDVHHIPAAIAAFCVAVTNNFLWNRH